MLIWPRSISALESGEDIRPQKNLTVFNICPFQLIKLGDHMRSEWIIVKQWGKKLHNSTSKFISSYLLDEIS